MPLDLGILKFLGWVAAHEATRGAIKNGIDNLGPVLKDRAKVLIETNYREEVIEVLRHLETYDPQASANINRKRDEALAAGRENILILALGAYLPRDEAKKVKMDEALVRFAWLGGKDDRGMNREIEGLIHDPIAQSIRYWISGPLEFVDRAATKLTTEHLKPTADRLRAEAEEKGVRSWLRFS